MRLPSARPVLTGGFSVRTSALTNGQKETPAEARAVTKKLIARDHTPDDNARTVIFRIPALGPGVAGGMMISICSGGSVAGGPSTHPEMVLKLTPHGNLG